MPLSNRERLYVGGTAKPVVQALPEWGERTGETDEASGSIQELR